MGTHVDTFKCPHCETTMSAQQLPNWTILNLAAGGSASVAMFSCSSCHKAIGAYAVPLPQKT